MRVLKHDKSCCRMCLLYYDNVQLGDLPCAIRTAEHGQLWPSLFQRQLQLQACLAKAEAKLIFIALQAARDLVRDCEAAQVGPSTHSCVEGGGESDRRQEVDSCKLGPEDLGTCSSTLRKCGPGLCCFWTLLLH